MCCLFSVGPRGWGDCPFLKGQGFNLSSTLLCFFFILGHALSPVLPFTNRQVNMDTVLAKANIIPNKKNMPYRVLHSHSLFWLSDLKINHHISLSANSQKVARYIIVCFYIKEYINDHLLKTSIRSWLEWSKESHQCEKVLQSNIAVSSLRLRIQIKTRWQVW